MTDEFALHGDFKLEVARLGADAAPVIVIDNFLASPEKLVERAAAARFSPVADALYPGVRARVGMDYSLALRRHLLGPICATFGLGDADVVGGQSDFSLVTTPPLDLSIRQRLPHFDGPDPNIIAFLHYLCGPEHGGTAFYRHRSTGYEFVDAGRADAFVRAVQSELAEHGMPEAAYVSGDTPLFERIGAFEAAFNRMLVYRGVSLHAGAIPPGFAFDPNPRTGRLTANTLLMLKARKA